MDLQTTLKLLDAGYTKEEITKMTTPTDALSPDPAKAPEPTPAPDPKPAPEPEKDQKETVTDTNKIIADLTKQVADIAGVVKSIQDSNAKGAKQDPPAKDTAQTVLESFFGKPN